jgi:hypothetical protein
LCEIGHRRKCAVGERDIDHLAFAGELAGVERGQDSNAGVEAGHNIAEGDAGFHGLFIDFAGVGHQACGPLSEKIIARLTGQRAAPSEAGD